MPLRSRLMNTEAIIGRSAATAVSFSTIEASNNHRLFLGLDRRHRLALLLVFEQLRLRRLHVIDQLLPGHAAPEHIGIRFRAGSPLRPHRGGRAHEDLVLVDARHRHLAGEAFGIDTL